MFSPRFPAAPSSYQPSSRWPYPITGGGNTHPSGNRAGIWRSGRNPRQRRKKPLRKPQFSDMITDIQADAISKMKVHPAILMKTKKCRFQVSGAKCQVPPPTISSRSKVRLPASAAPVMGKLRENGRGDISKMKVHPAMFMKINKDRFHVSGARC